MFAVLAVFEKKNPSRADCAPVPAPSDGGTAAQITDNLKRYRDAGMDMPLLWPPFSGVPVSKTLDDLKRLTEEIMPKVNAG